jgi:hypothetical protein
MCIQYSLNSISADYVNAFKSSEKREGNSGIISPSPVPEMLEAADSQEPPLPEAFGSVRRSGWFGL